MDNSLIITRGVKCKKNCGNNTEKQRNKYTIVHNKTAGHNRAKKSKYYNVIRKYNKYTIM